MPTDLHFCLFTLIFKSYKILVRDSVTFFTRRVSIVRTHAESKEYMWDYRTGGFSDATEEFRSWNGFLEVKTMGMMVYKAGLELCEKYNGNRGELPSQQSSVLAAGSFTMDPATSKIVTGITGRMELHWSS